MIIETLTPHAKRVKKRTNVQGIDFCTSKWYLALYMPLSEYLTSINYTLNRRIIKEEKFKVRRIMDFRPTADWKIFTDKDGVDKQISQALSARVELP